MSQNNNLWVQYPGNGAGNGKHIVLVSGDEEYRSEEALPMLGQILSAHHGFQLPFCLQLTQILQK